jgi:hypothetical protein
VASPTANESSRPRADIFVCLLWVMGSMFFSNNVLPWAAGTRFTHISRPTPATRKSFGKSMAKAAERQCYSK